MIDAETTNWKLRRPTEGLVNLTFPRTGAVNYRCGSRSVDLAPLKTAGVGRPFGEIELRTERCRANGLYAPLTTLIARAERILGGDSLGEKDLRLAEFIDLTAGPGRALSRALTAATRELASLNANGMGMLVGVGYRGAAVESCSRSALSPSRRGARLAAARLWNDDGATRKRLHTSPLRRADRDFAPRARPRRQHALAARTLSRPLRLFAARLHFAVPARKRPTQTFVAKRARVGDVNRDGLRLRLFERFRGQIPQEIRAKPPPRLIGPRAAGAVAEIVDHVLDDGASGDRRRCGGTVAIAFETERLPPGPRPARGGDSRRRPACVLTASNKSAMFPC